MSIRSELEHKLNRCYATTASGLYLVLVPNIAAAYLGPGAGLGMIGSLIAIIVVALVIVLGLIIYPVRMLRKRKKQAVVDEDKSVSADDK